MRNFKKLIVLSLVLVSFLFCQKDDDSSDPADYSTLIIATWHLDSTSTNGVADPPEDCQEFFAVTFTFDLDLTVYEREGDNCNLSIQTHGTYAIDGSNATFIIGNETIVGGILILNNTTLKLKFVLNGITNVENYTKIE